MKTLAYITLVVYTVYLLIGLTVNKKYIYSSKEDFFAYLVAMAGATLPIILSALVITGN